MFAPSEEGALMRLELVFSRLRANDLKVAWKKVSLPVTFCEILGLCAGC